MFINRKFIFSSKWIKGERRLIDSDHSSRRHKYSLAALLAWWSFVSQHPGMFLSITDIYIAPGSHWPASDLQISSWCCAGIGGWCPERKTFAAFPRGEEFIIWRGGQALFAILLIVTKTQLTSGYQQPWDHYDSHYNLPPERHKSGPTLSLSL